MHSVHIHTHMKSLRDGKKGNLVIDWLNYMHVNSIYYRKSWIILSYILYIILYIKAIL